jgi:aryl-alcohol dehydrogenase-like predicted oxidoreductase
MGGPTSFEELCIAMQDLIDEGKIRGWGLCNDNAYGLAACTRTAKGLGVTPPCSIRGDFSLIDRKVRAVWVMHEFLNSSDTESKSCHWLYIKTE